jgi:hypothetical protein
LIIRIIKVSDFDDDYEDDEDLSLDDVIEGEDYDDDEEKMSIGAMTWMTWIRRIGVINTVIPMKNCLKMI